MGDAKQPAASTQQPAEKVKVVTMIADDAETVARIMLAFRRASSLLNTLDAFSEKIRARVCEHDPNSGQLLEEIVLEFVRKYTALYPSIRDIHQDLQIFGDVQIHPKAVM